jgi:hypothetical protein
MVKKYKYTMSSSAAAFPENGKIPGESHNLAQLLARAQSDFNTKVSV